MLKNLRRTSLLCLVVLASMFALPFLQGCGGGGSSTTPPVQPALAVTTSSLAAGTIGVAYSTSLVATGGSGAGYSWTVSSGSLPGGLTLSSAGCYLRNAGGGGQLHLHGQSHRLRRSYGDGQPFPDHRRRGSAGACNYDQHAPSRNGSGRLLDNPCGHRWKRHRVYLDRLVRISACGAGALLRRRTLRHTNGFRQLHVLRPKSRTPPRTPRRPAFL